MAETNHTSLLDLETRVERKHITIDGTAYLLRQLSEFSLIERHVFAQHGRAMGGLAKIGNEEESAAEAVQKATDGLNATFHKILIDSEEIASKLTDEQKLAVLNCFFQQAVVTAEKKPEMIPDPAMTETATLLPPPGSSDSTEEIPVAG